MLLMSCSSNKKHEDVNATLTREIINQQTDVVFMVPDDWRVVSEDKEAATHVASRFGHGFESCRVGKMKVSSDISGQRKQPVSLSDLDNYFLSHAVSRIEQKGKIKFLKSEVETLSGIKMGGTFKDEEGSGVTIRGFVKNLDSYENQHMTIYIGYSADINNRAGVECFMLGKDKNEKFLDLFKAISKSINYKNEYYQ